MNKTLFAAAASVFILAGCSSGPDESAMAMAGMDELKNQVAQLTSEVNALKNEQSTAEMKAKQAADSAMAAQEEAARANERIDNIAQSYTK